MIDHFEVKVCKYEECKEFYSCVLKPLDIELQWSDESAAGFGLSDDSKTRFLIEESMQVASCHLAFSAADRDAVNEFHLAGKGQGYACNGPPGLREKYAPNYYAAFLLDPDGNNVEAVVYL